MSTITLGMKVTCFMRPDIIQLINQVHAPVRQHLYRHGNKHCNFGQLLREFCWIWRDCKSEYVAKHWHWLRSGMKILWQERPRRSNRITDIYCLLKANNILVDSALAFEAAEHLVKIHTTFYWKLRRNRFYNRDGFKLLVSLLSDISFWCARGFDRIAMAMDLVRQHHPYLLP